VIFNLQVNYPSLYHWKETYEQESGICVASEHWMHWFVKKLFSILYTKIPFSALISPHVCAFPKAIPGCQNIHAVDLLRSVSELES
jgi:hypothetical protein